MADVLTTIDEEKVAEIEKGSTELSTRVKSMKIKTEAEYITGGELLKQIAAAKKKAKEFMEPIVKSAKAHHTLTTQRRAQLLKPLEEADNVLRPKVGAYLQNKRDKEEARARKLREKEMEKQRKAQESEAAALEKEGMKEEAEAVRTQELVPAPLVAQRKPPKVAGIHTMETTDFEVVSEKLIPREFLSVDSKKIRSYIKRHGKEAKIAGVRIFSKTSVVAKG